MTTILTSKCCKSDPNRPLRGGRGRFGTLLQQIECGIFERTAVGLTSSRSFVEDQSHGRAKTHSGFARLTVTQARPHHKIANRVTRTQQLGHVRARLSVRKKAISDGILAMRHL